MNKEKVKQRIQEEIDLYTMMAGLVMDAELSLFAMERVEDYQRVLEKVEEGKRCLLERANLAFMDFISRRER